MITIYSAAAIAEARKAFDARETIMLFGAPYRIASMRLELNRYSHMGVGGLIEKDAISHEVAYAELEPV